MSLTLTVCEKTPGAAPPHEYPVEFTESRLTVRELLRNIVFQQVYNRNNEIRDTSRVRSDAEALLNQKSKTPGQTIDWVPKFDHAVEAFENNQVILLLDGTQIESLDETVNLTSNTKLTFLKLIPLVGG